jgi:hypothetical protein
LDKIIDKYLTGTITRVELKQLLSWLKDPANKDLFTKQVGEHYQLNLLLQKDESDTEYVKLLNKLEQPSKDAKIVRIPYQKWFTRAAILVGAIGLGYYFFQNSNQLTDPLTDENVITLTQEDGRVRVIRADRDGKILSNEGEVVATQSGAILNYQDVDPTTEKMGSPESVSYNELIVPNGKRIQLVLSDGTMVHLNAGSTLKYPVRFLRSGPRKVFLDGEAFFEVTRDVEHPFTVKAQNIEITVLGTQFNVNSYSSDRVVNTVLAEGSVEINHSDDLNINQIRLTPNQIASFDRSEKRIRVGQVDANEYIAWTRGELWFQSRTFPEILKVLERHYDVTINNHYSYLDNQKFFARFDSQTIEQVLQLFQNSESFSYTIKGNIIEINRP